MTTNPPLPRKVHLAMGWGDKIRGWCGVKANDPRAVQPIEFALDVGKVNCKRCLSLYKTRPKVDQA